MKTLLLILLPILVSSPTLAQDPPWPDKFQAGVYADETRTLTCISGSAGDIFQQVVWAWVPDNLGLAYITLRFEFPDNLDLTSRPVFNNLVSNVIFTEFPDNTSEWNMVFDDCPSGWVRVLTQSFTLRNDQPSQIGLLGSRSMMRDCTFFLNDVIVLSELSVNDPDCGLVGDVSTTWSSLKATFR